MIALVHYRPLYQVKRRGKGDVFPFHNLWCGPLQRHQSIDLLWAHWQQSPRLSKRPLRGLGQSLSEVKRSAWQNKSGCTPCRFGQPRTEQHDGIDSDPHSGSVYCAALVSLKPLGPSGGRREERLQSAETCENDEPPRIDAVLGPVASDAIARANHQYYCQAVLILRRWHSARPAPSIQLGSFKSVAHLHPSKDGEPFTHTQPLNICRQGRWSSKVVLAPCGFAAKYRCV
ncbi:hypothetical protein PSV09DRAFT_2255738 [Bipolaris maydis]|uniref:uncharacterized protein n=1 Tax=Cochliobolus heterostrophus TaxID=5016 RepID=UPI0024D70297|nr:hypothetical protein J3E73DRAFT_258644 [Bipolaris maydis]KAJ6212451.1 hypothetical protein PSV09DRAFT_2255738 [Bipolaris maydis]KAJ6266244.1 hypothetical protein PSV08DRAFT_251979 [Bipolaris maydis]KAJ6281258.1 hypothetical protein J3E71DRAFT_241524 [Bipolaris maydis]